MQTRQRDTASFPLAAELLGMRIAPPRVDDYNFITADGRRAVEEAQKLREQAARDRARLQEQLERHRQTLEDVRRSPVRQKHTRKP